MMKKTFKLVAKILAGFILLLLILLFIVPILFRDKIRTKVEQVIAESVNAKVKFEDYSIGFFRNFPDLTFSLTGLSVAGIDKFESDTLASVGSFNLAFSLPSLFKKSGYEIKSILVDNARIHAIVLKDGSVNWDIMKDTTSTDESKQTESSSGMKILLKKVSVKNSYVAYLDAESDIQTYLEGLNMTLSGDMTETETDLKILAQSSRFTYVMEGMKYISRTKLDADIDMLANLDTWKFTFRENYVAINDLKLNFSGTVEMPGDDIKTDISFSTPQSSFGSLLSLIPAVYMKDYSGLKTTGEFALSGTAKGVYSDADSTMPDISVSLSVSNGLVKYPDLPEQISNINVRSELFVDGKLMDRSVVDVQQFHFELAGNPFDMKMSLKTPVSDPDFSGYMKGHIDLAALSNSVPLDSVTLSGIIDVSLEMAGRLSSLEKEQYSDFRASGKMSFRNMNVTITGYPDVRINSADFEFAPAYAALSNTSLNVGGKSDFSLEGRLSNYLPYFLRNETINGNLSLHSKHTDLSEIMSKMASDTSQVGDTTSLAVVKVPENIDFDFTALIDDFSYDRIRAKNVKGHIIIRDGILSLRQTGMEILGGSMVMNADYDTRDTLRPLMKADFDMQSVAVKDAFTTFNSVQKLTPAASGINGKISLKLGFRSLLAKDMMPVISTISGDGKLKSDELTLVESKSFNTMKEVLKLGPNYSNTFRDVNISFRINDGRLWVSPFDIKTGNLKMNIGGDQGLDQTMNYLVKTEMPRSDLGSSVNALVDNLSAQAAAFGINFKPSDIIKVNLKVTGTVTKPVITPVFGNSSASAGTGTQSTVKEAVQSAEDAARVKAREEAQKQADQLVKEAEARGEQLRSEAAKAAENLRKEADVRAKKLIDDSAKKSQIEKIAAQQGAEAIRKGADKKADQLVKEADTQANKLVEEARKQGDELVKKI